MMELQVLAPITSPPTSPVPLYLRSTPTAVQPLFPQHASLPPYLLQVIAQRSPSQWGLP